jgi:predicted transcriptional regulator
MQLSRRERQIMDIVYEAGRATAAEIRDRMDDPPSYSAVRALLRVLEEKGHLRHESDGPRYVYLPTVSPRTARRRALRHLLRTFFEGSTEGAVAALLEMDASRLSDEELDRMEQLIEQARKEGR